MSDPRTPDHAVIASDMAALQLRNTELTATNKELADKIANYQGDRPFFTLEFFPPKTDEV